MKNHPPEGMTGSLRGRLTARKCEQIVNNPSADRKPDAWRSVLCYTLNGRPAGGPGPEAPRARRVLGSSIALRLSLTHGFRLFFPAPEFGLQIKVIYVIMLISLKYHLLKGVTL